MTVAALQICGVSSVRHCRDDERADILAIVNAAACRGVIALDRWQEPYVPARELDSEITSWADADWAVRFLYLRHGFELVAPERKTALFKTYWIIRDRVRPRDFAQGGRGSFVGLRRVVDAIMGGVMSSA